MKSVNGLLSASFVRLIHIEIGNKYKLPNSTKQFHSIVKMSQWGSMFENITIKWSL